MAGPSVRASSVEFLLALRISKCEHLVDGKKEFITVSSHQTIGDVFEEYHPSESDEMKKGLYEMTCWCSIGLTSSEKFKVHSYQTVGDLANTFGIKCIEFDCERTEKPTTSTEATLIRECAKAATDKSIDAFQILMARGRAFAEKKPSSAGVKHGLTRKDELYNSLVDNFTQRGLDWPKSEAPTEGKYFIQVLCNTLWYITNQQTVISDAALRKKGVLPVPPEFEQYTGYNDVKRKRLKEMPLSAEQLETHSQTLYSILLKPVINSSPSWSKMGSEIKKLADCLIAYKNYLHTKAKTIKSNRSLDHPVRTIDEHATIEHRNKTIMGVKPIFQLLDKVMKSRDLLNPLLFDEHMYLEKPFESALQRYRFFSELQLSVPVDIVRFSPGGSIVTTHCIVRVSENRSETQILTEGARFLQKVKPNLQEFHTRAQRRLFKDRLKNVAKISPSTADLIYKELAMDSSTAQHPVTQERLRMIYLGEQGLVTDLRHLNPGKPSGKFDTFFEHLMASVEEVTAADERRHNIAHLSEWLSLRDLMKRVEERCPPGTAIPSKSLVRLQFAPRNPYTKAAANFTSKIEVQYKVQRRQLRASHPDQHYCAAQLKYLKQKAVELKENAELFFCDDKAKIPIGEPGKAVSTGVRGKKSIVPCSTTIASLDHDMTKASLTPSVILKCHIPDSVDKSFVRGKVTTIINESVFQMSSPFRHAVALSKIMKDSTCKILLKFTDGGTDQRNTLESVKCATICLFLELNLDMIILCRCAPGQSWTNPAERVMSILNIGLQNCALERLQGDYATETELKRCGSMADIRARAETKPELKEKWKELTEPAQVEVMSRFMRLSLKDEPLQAMDPVSTDDIYILKRHLREHFPELDLNKLTKVHTKKVQSYNSWIEKHCRVRHYNFQIRKCEDENCCLPSTLPRQELQWLPDPMIDEQDTEHFRKYSDIKHVDTTEQDRPSLQKQNKRSVIQSYPSDKEQNAECTTDKDTDTATEDVPDTEQAVNLYNIVKPLFGDSSLCTTQNARSIVTCVECQKPRLLYCKYKLTERQEVSLSMLLSEYEYSCGAPITPPTHYLNGKVVTRSNLQCLTAMEIPFYGSGLGRQDLCTHCGLDGGIVDMELKKRFKSVLPLCDECKSKGILPLVQRPYGKK